MFEDQICLITGGTGSWGHALTRALLEQQPKEIRIFSRNEYNQVEMQRRFADPRLRFIVGDVRDLAALQQACEGVNTVFHLAALKHVPVCEAQPEEALKTNVMGTMNIVHASIAANVDKVVDVSTDKAVLPHNFYGTTKAIGEKLILQANSWSQTTRFVCIRAGNVLGTNGSVVPLFQRQIRDHGEMTITSLEMTRFFLTISDAIQLLLQAASMAVGGETLVMKMSACKITDLAQTLARHWSTQPIGLREIGVRPGEKLHEVLISPYEVSQTRQFGDRYYVILPDCLTESLRAAYFHLPKVSFAQYDSSSSLMDSHSIEAMLQRGGFLP